MTALNIDYFSRINNRGRKNKMGKDRIKVLVVDDEKIIRDFFQRLLSLLNLEVAEAENGYKAIEMAQKEKFDLCFIDVRMPGLNGLETYREIRKTNPEAVVVLTTGYAVEEILEQAQKEGVECHIHKPFNINEINTVIDKVRAEKTGAPFNILVIDDEEVILNFFSAFFKSKDLKYKVASDKNEAMAAVKKEKFDLIFLDLILKDTNGGRLYKEIKDVLPQANIVLITGYPRKLEEIKQEIQQDIKQEIELTGCLFKPFEIDSILKFIEMAKAKIK